MKKNYSDALEEFDEKFISSIKKEDYLCLLDNTGDTLEVMPASTSFEEGHKLFNIPFFLLMKDPEFKESVSVGLSLDQAIELRDFLSDKIEKITKR